MSFSFVNYPAFYYLLMFGIASLMPRARYAADQFAQRVENPKAKTTPATFVQRWCVLIPGMCLLYAVVMMRSPIAAVVLTACFVVCFALMILFLRGSKSSD